MRVPEEWPSRSGRPGRTEPGLQAVWHAFPRFHLTRRDSGIDGFRTEGAVRAGRYRFTLQMPNPARLVDTHGDNSAAANLRP